MLKETSIQIKNYTLLQKIGEGGYGAVFKAEQQSTGQIVAIKMLSFTTTLDQQSKNHQIARFDRETRLCAEINHPNIVKLIDKGFTATQEPFAVFEYVSGITLKEYIQSQQGLSALETGALMGQVLDALACAHAHGIVHRDLKPHNIMVTQTGAKSYVKVLDFGVGTFTNDLITAIDKNLTATKEVLGTPSYSAPEQLRGEPTTVKSDLYAWGLIFIECLTGHPVVQGDTVALIFQQQLSMIPIDIPPAIVRHPIGALLKRILEKNPQQRIPSVEHIIESYTKINFSTIVGDIASSRHNTETTDESTVVNQLAWRSTHSEKKQLTVLCAKLNVVPNPMASLDMETLEAIQKDQLSFCKDTGVRFGAYISGTLADTILMYFGYPKTNDTDARRAGRTALELMGQFQKRSALLLAQQGIALDIKIAIHSGTAYIQHKSEPEGIVTNLAFNLLQHTPSGQILAGAETKQLLAPYLKFESFETPMNSNPLYTTATFLLTGERPAEALSHLSPSGAQQEMIGRQAEQQRILDAWETTGTAEAQAIVVKGQAGIGKSKLIYESKKHWIAKGIVVLEARCLPEYQNNALYPIFEMLKSYLGLQETVEDHTPHLTAALKKAGCETAIVLPILHSWFALPGGEQYEPSTLLPERQKEVIFQTLKQCILAHSTQHNFVVILEDLHWVDPTSLEFITQLLPTTTPNSYFILGTARPEFETDWDTSRVHTIRLQSLKDNMAEALVKGILEHEVDKDTLMYIIERTDGIPLFIEDLTHMLVDQHYLTLAHGSYQLIANFDRNSIPTTLQGLLHARLDRLGFAKETAQLAAAIGRSFSYDLLVASSLHDEAMVQADLNTLLDANLIYHQRSIENDSYIFRHALIRDAAYDSMVTTVRQETHGRIASQLEHNTPNFAQENPFELARHLAEATYYQNATVYGLQAIQKQIKNSLNAEALQSRNIVLNWTSKIQINSVKLENELKINDLTLPAQMGISGYGSKEVVAINKRNEELITAIQQDQSTLSNTELQDMAHRIEWGLFLNYHFHSKRKDASTVAYNILDNLKKHPNRDIEVGVLPMIANALHADGKLEESAKLCHRVFEIYNVDTDVDIGIRYSMEPKSSASYFLSGIYLSQGMPNNALIEVKKGIAWAEEIQHPVSITLAYLFYTLIAYFLDDKDLVKTIVKQHDSLQINTEENWVTTHLKMIEAWSTEDISYAETYVANTLASNQYYALSWYEPTLAETYITSGEYDKAITLLENSLVRSTEDGELWMLALVKRVLAESHYAKTQKITPEINRLLIEAVGDAKEIGAIWFELAALVTHAEFLNQQGDSITNMKDGILTLYNQLDTTEHKLAQRVKQLYPNFN